MRAYRSPSSLGASLEGRAGEVGLTDRRRGHSAIRPEGACYVPVSRSAEQEFLRSRLTSVWMFVGGSRMSIPKPPRKCDRPWAPAQPRAGGHTGHTSAVVKQAGARLRIGRQPTTEHPTQRAYQPPKEHPTWLYGTSLNPTLTGRRRSTTVRLIHRETVLVSNGGPLPINVVVNNVTTEEVPPGASITVTANQVRVKRTAAGHAFGWYEVA